MAAAEGVGGLVKAAPCLPQIFDHLEVLLETKVLLKLIVFDIFGLRPLFLFIFSENKGTKVYLIHVYI